MTRRVWREVVVAGEEVWLDGRPVRLPGGEVLRLQYPALAEAVAREWRELGEQFGPENLKLTGLAGAAQARVRPQREAMALTLARYAESDVLCYRAESPASLVALQAARWQPWLDWAARRYGARLTVTSDVVFVAQPEPALAALRGALLDLSAEVLAALGLAVPVLGSCVLGLALADGAIGAAAALEASVLDETYGEQLWGRDAAAAARRAAMLGDVEIAVRFMELCGVILHGERCARND